MKRHKQSVRPDDAGLRAKWPISPLTAEEHESLLGYMSATRRWERDQGLDQWSHDPPSASPIAERRRDEAGEESSRYAG